MKRGQHFRDSKGLEIIFESFSRPRRYWAQQVEYRVPGDPNIYAMDRKAFGLQFKPVQEVKE